MNSEIFQFLIENHPQKLGYSSQQMKGNFLIIPGYIKELGIKDQNFAWFSHQTSLYSQRHMAMTPGSLPILIPTKKIIAYNQA